MTTVDGLLDEARARTGLDDIGSEHVRERLGAVVEDLGPDGPLHDRGRAIVTSQVRRTMERRLRLVETFRRHPEIEDVALPPILHVSGLPRTGTTLLHNVLDRHPRVRTLKSWELKEPLPPPEAATYATDPRIAEADARLAPLRGTALERIHWVEATDPDESQWATTDLTGLFGGGAPSALNRLMALLWDRERSMVPTFTELRRTIQLLLWRNPVPEGGVLVLKDPTTTAHLDQFVGVFGDVHVAAVHRDPHRVALSADATGRAVVAPLTDAPRPVYDDPTRYAAIQLGGLMDGLDAAGDRALHVAYPALVADPVGAAAGLLDAVGLDGADERFVTAATDHLARQRSGGRARPFSRYEPVVDRAELAAEPTVATYLDRFGVEPEERRLTGA